MGLKMLGVALTRRVGTLARLGLASKGNAAAPQTKALRPIVVSTVRVI
jgi:hypothetical protein